MRPSKRDLILAAALHVVESKGVSAVTFESVAAEAGLTKGGLLYHFPTKEALLLALHDFLAHQWEESLVQALGCAPEDATEEDKAAAYVRTSVHSVTRAELLLMLEAQNDSELSRPWTEVVSRWAPGAAALADDPEALPRLVAYLAADGLWLSGSLGALSLPLGVRKKLADEVIALTRESGKSTGSGPPNHGPAQKRVDKPQ